MAKHKYIRKTENGAKAVGRHLPISTKHSIEICRAIRGEKVEKAGAFLGLVAEKKAVVPFKRFNKDMGHKPGMASGRYPKKAASEIKKIIESASINAQFKGLNTGKLVVAHIAAHRAPAPTRGGRHRGRSAKRTHIEVILEEAEILEKKHTAKRSLKGSDKSKKITEIAERKKEQADGDAQ